MKINTKIIENNLKINFNNKKLLIQSLTHKSYNEKYNNEKLEFLGDRVIGLVISKKLLSTNNENWNTIPRTYSEIDTLRIKFERDNQPEKLKILDDINAYVEDLEKYYSSA